MSPSPAKEDDAPGTTASSSSCLALAWHVWVPCALHVALVFSSVAVAAAVVVLLPLACMAASLCLICGIAAQLRSPTSFVHPDRTAEHGGSEVGEVASSDNDFASFREEEDQEGEEAEFEISSCLECTAAYADGAQFIDPRGRGDEQEHFFWVDAGSYYCYKKFYDLLNFWTRKERTGRR